MIRLNTPRGTPGPSTKPTSAILSTDLFDDRVGVGRREEHLDGVVSVAGGEVSHRDEPTRQQMLGDGQTCADPKTRPLVLTEGAESGVKFASHLE